MIQALQRALLGTVAAAALIFAAQDAAQAAAKCVKGDRKPPQRAAPSHRPARGTPPRRPAAWVARCRHTMSGPYGSAIYICGIEPWCAAWQIGAS